MALPMMRDATDTIELTPADPPPRFPSAADLELAERLRRKIEERYLGAAATPASMGPNTALR